MMKFLFTTCFIIFITVVELQAQRTLRFTWDYSDLEIGSINRFEVKVDAGSYESIGIPGQEITSTTLPLHHSYSYTATFVGGGTHLFSVRACDAIECSMDASMTFKQVGPPSNPRIVP